MTDVELQVSSMTGRRRKLSDGVMLDICNQFADGAKVRNLAETYGVSEHTIYSICYWTPRNVEPERNEDNS